jgi:phosphoglycolate phosphatase
MDKKLLVCDLDNTLYDWVGYFVPSFYAMVDVAVAIMKCDREKLLDDFRIVHQHAHDSEHPFALLETQTVKDLYEGTPRLDVIQALDPAFHAFNSARKKNLKLYPQVRETLDLLSSSGITLVAHTESKLYGVVDRLRRLDLYRYFSRIYCRERLLDGSPSGKTLAEWLNEFPIERVTELASHQAKPSKEVLLEICADENLSPEETAYVGDSISRDMLMAKRAGVLSIWAEYGTKRDPETYAALVRVTHWTPDEVAREKMNSEEAKSIKPDCVAHSSFAEVAGALGIGREQNPFTSLEYRGIPG